jgi:uncharacterized membrane protein YeaQ/YmgE (transglycosylase-associated protein family)
MRLASSRPCKSRFPGFGVRGIVLAMTALLGGSLHAEDAAPGDVYVRRHTDVSGIVSWLAAEARRIEAAQVLVAFDAASFAPPPGQTEFTAQYGFFRDLPAWIEALGDWAAEAGPRSFRGTSSIATLSIDMRAAGWKERLTDIVARRWWELDAFRQFEPAPRWMKRLLARNESAPGLDRRRANRMLVVVTGGITPERWIPAGTTDGFESEWRTKLLPVGRYWDGDQVGRLVRDEGARLYVVAPEARFGDFEPYPERGVHLRLRARRGRAGPSSRAADGQPPAAAADHAPGARLQWRRIHPGRADDPLVRMGAAALRCPAFPIGGDPMSMLVFAGVVGLSLASPIDWIVLIVVGGLIGWVASILMKTNSQMGILANVVVGIIGAIAGHYLAGVLGIAVTGTVSMLLVDLGGAVLLLILLRFLGVLR